jgi:hypothetical protein
MIKGVVLSANAAYFGGNLSSASLFSCIMTMLLRLCCLQEGSVQGISEVPNDILMMC